MKHFQLEYNKKQTLSLILSLMFALFVTTSIIQFHMLTLFFSIILSYMLIDFFVKLGNIVHLCIVSFFQKEKRVRFATKNFKKYLKQENKLSNEENEAINKNLVKSSKVEKITNFIAISLVLGIVGLSIFYLSIKGINVVKSDYQSLLLKLENILLTTKENKIGEILSTNLGLNLDLLNLQELKQQVIDFLIKNIQSVQNLTKSGLVIAAHFVLGLIIAILIFLSINKEEKNTINKNLAFEKSNEKEDLTQEQQDRNFLNFHLTERIRNFYKAFSSVFSAQIKISLVDTLLTAIYILIVLPLFDINLNFKYTVISLVFLFGLIPIVGNLVSNTIIFLLSLAFSWQAAIMSLIFLIVIHKLEYFLNAKLIGSKLNAKTYELLLIMIITEHIFGLGALILSPFYYAYLKTELKYFNLIK